MIESQRIAAEGEQEPTQDAELAVVEEPEYFGRIRQWASDRNLINGSDSKSQFLKLQSEKGELAEAIRLGNRDEIIDGIGDASVVLTIIAAQNGIEITNDVIQEEVSYINGIVERSQGFVYSFLSLDAQIGRLGDAIAKGQDVNAPIMKSILELQFLAQMYHVQMGVEAAKSYAFALENAWNDIKDRKGVMYNGVFVKSTDERYESIVAELAAAQKNTD
ncbi:conserved phage protein [Burkholderia phage BcepF1]|uniref:Conserved phage protein n=1 Tax=Burkholderia phage BcepF1 TaxID=2886897 RepID=A1YZZ1_9CAUD|nr:MazG-like pyrophosphatase [Burkholderia phage BcepF1]ABL96818.1 conserved phage protein [Burkholderia phage BcepF1]